VGALVASDGALAAAIVDAWDRDRTQVAPTPPDASDWFLRLDFDRTSWLGFTRYLEPITRPPLQLGALVCPIRGHAWRVDAAGRCEATDYFDVRACPPDLLAREMETHHAASAEHVMATTRLGTAEALAFAPGRCKLDVATTRARDAVEWVRRIAGDAEAVRARRFLSITGGVPGYVALTVFGDGRTSWRLYARGVPYHDVDGVVGEILDD